MKRLINIIFICIFVLFIAATPVYTLFSKKPDMLFYENRSLATFPELSFESLWSGYYFAQIENYFSDVFPFRDDIMRERVRFDGSVLKKPVVNDIVIQGEGEPLLPGMTVKPCFKEQLKTDCSVMADRVAALNNAVNENGGRFYYVGLPEQYSYFNDRFPKYIFNNSENLQAVSELFFNALDERSIDYINMKDVFEKENKPEEYYSFIDHHFTYYGAFRTYEEIIDRVNGDLGYGLHKLKEGEDFNFKALENPYMGSRNRKLMGGYDFDEKLVIADYINRVPFARSDNGGEPNSVLFSYPSDVNEAVTYTTYMSGDMGETVLKTNRSGLPNLLIIGDSFTNAIETLIYTDFNEMRSLDYRYYDKKTMTEYINEYKPDVALMIRDDTNYLEFGENGDIK